MKKKPVRRRRYLSKGRRRIPHIVVKLSFTRSRRSYHLRQKVGEDDYPGEEFSCSDYPAMRSEHPLIVRRLLKIPGIKEIRVHRQSIEISIGKAFLWDELQPRIIRTLHQTFWSSQPQIIVLQQVPSASSPSKLRLEEVVQSRPPQLPKRILLEKEKTGSGQTQCHLTLPLAKTVFWKTDEQGLCRPPRHLKDLVEAILAVPGVTHVCGSPYEIRVYRGAVFNKKEVQDSVIDILRQLFPNPASVVVETAPLLDSSQTTDSPETKDAIPEIQWRVHNPASRMLVATFEGSQSARYFHLGRELADWDSLHDRHDDVLDWLQKPLEQLFSIPGVATIAIDKYSMTVDIAQGFRWSKVQPAVVAIIEGICRPPVQVIYQRRVSQASGKTRRSPPKFTAPGIFWHPGTTSNRERRYETSIWPAGTGNWRQWKSDGASYQPGLDEFSPDLQHFINELLQAPGVTALNIRPYAVKVEIGKAFNWTECQPAILQILSSLYPESERQHILVRKKKWRRAGQLDKPPKYQIGTARIFIARGYIEKVRDFHLSIPTLLGTSWCSDTDSFRKLPKHLRATVRELAAGAGIKSVTVRPWQVQVYRTNDTDDATIEEMALALLKKLFPKPEDVIVRRLPK